MPRLVGTTQIWHFLGLFAVSVLALAALPFVATALMETPNAGPALRLAAVALGVGALVPLTAFVIWSYRRSDEFERHQMLLQLAVAFAVNALATSLVDHLQFAGYVARPVPFPHWWLAIISWWVAIVVVRIATRSMHRE